MKGTAVQVSIIIVAFESRDYIGDCLKSIPEAIQHFSHEVIVIDNASSDNTVEVVGKFPARLVRNPENTGFGRACNQGAKISSGKYILFSNPDTVYHPDSLDRLMSFMENNPGVGITGPGLVDGAGKQQRTIRKYPGAWDIFHSISRKTARISDATPSTSQKTDWVAGACLLVRRDVFENVGGFDERFFLFFEEVDLCKRVQQSGFENWVVPDSTVTHYAGKSSEKLGREAFTEIFHRSEFIYLQKHSGTICAMAAGAGRMSIYLTAAIIRSATNFVMKEKYKRPSTAWRNFLAFCRSIS